MNQELPADTTAIGLPGVSAADLTTAERQSVQLGESDQQLVGALLPDTALLLVLRGPNAGAKYLLDTNEVSIGRNPKSDIFLDDVTVSRRHAVFVRKEGQFQVQDIGSLNGTYVNRESVDAAVLRSGDEVMVGKFRLVFFQALQP